MPNYEYTCQKCGHYFEQTLRMVDNKLPESQACPSCTELGFVEQTHSQMAPLGDPVRLGITKPPGDVREMLQRVQAKSPKATVKDHSQLAKI